MRRLRLTLLSIPILLFISLAATFIAATRHETVLTDETRASLPGSYVRLSSGTVRYDWHGPSDGPVVVLIHGFSTPSFVFQRNVPAMVKAGFRVLTYDHFGRGYSDRPDAVYDENFYDRELLEILNAQNVKEPVSVLGYSLGGGIAAVFAARHPDRVKKLMLVAPVGYMPPASGSTRLLRVPVLGEWLFAVIGKSSMIKEFETERAQGIATEEMVRLYAEQFSYHGYRNALLSTVRHFPFSTLSKEYETLGRSHIPILVLWGSDDTTVPTAGYQKIKAAVPHARLVILKDMNHSLVYAHPNEVNAVLLDFIEQKRGP